MERENRRLRDQLNRLLATVRDNQQTLERFNAQELELIAAGTLAELSEALLGNIPQNFDLDQVHLILHDPEGELSSLFGFAGIDGLPGLHLMSDIEALRQLAGPADRLWLGSGDDARWGEDRRIAVPQQGSAAILPLVRMGQLIGCYILISHNPARYHPDSGTLFLARLAAVVAVCLENALNRERLRHAGLTDPLTGVSNRRYFEQRLRESVAHAIRSDGALSCLFADIDHFKSINDRFGHEAGDIVLREVAQRIRRELRTEDLLARYGGEEFVILLPDTTGQTAIGIAERIRQLVADTRVALAGQENLSVTLSMGVAELADSDPQLEHERRMAELLLFADKAMYQAKRRGRNQVIRHSAGIPD